ncbi:hypothetical protein ACFL6T_02230 [Candidatus Zixiibacteriota bacterium]
MIGKTIVIILLGITVIQIPGCAGPDDSILTIEHPLRLDEHLDYAQIECSAIPQNFVPVQIWDEKRGLNKWEPFVSPVAALKPVEIRLVDGTLKITIGEQQKISDIYAGGIWTTIESGAISDWSYLVVRARITGELNRFGAWYNLGQPAPEANPANPFMVSGDWVTTEVGDGSDQTYLIRTDWIREDWQDWDGQVREICLIFQAESPSTVEIQSISILPRNYAYSTPSYGVCMEPDPPGGLDWNGRNVYRRGIYSPAPSRMAWRVLAPESGQLDIGCGTVGHEPIRFRITAQMATGDEVVLFEKRVDDSSDRVRTTIDLSRFANKTIELVLHCDSDSPGSIGLWIDPVLSTSPLAAEKASTLRVLFLGTSEFGASGTLLVPFQRFCTAVGIACEAYRQYDFLGPGSANRPPARVRDVIKDVRFAQLIEDERFDFVVLSGWEFEQEYFEEGKEKDTIAAFQELHRTIVQSGGQTVLFQSYPILGSRDDLRGIVDGYTTVKSVLDTTEINGQYSKAILVPVGELWVEAYEHFELETIWKMSTIPEVGTIPCIRSNFNPEGNNWYQDPRHATRLAQYATACLFYTFITGRNPHLNPFADNATPEQSAWIKRVVWQLASSQVRDDF